MEIRLVGGFDDGFLAIDSDGSDIYQCVSWRTDNVRLEHHYMKTTDVDDEGYVIYRWDGIER